MNRTLDIITGLIGIIVALALVVAGVVHMLKKSVNPSKIVLKALVTIPFVVLCLCKAPNMNAYGPLLILVMGIVLSAVWTPHLANFLVSPLTNIFDGGNEPPEKKPLYSIAMTKRNRGKPREAIEDIRRQLELFPNDFEGVMLMASIQAETLFDLSAAENSLNHFCEAKDTPPVQVAAAYTHLADWHLKLSADADAARVSLQKIIARYPETELALHAEQRIAHLVEAEKQILDKHDRQNVELREGVKNIGLLDSTDFLKQPEVEPGKLAAIYVKHLEEHPHDSEVREKLALIYGKDYKRLDLATMELEHLINEPRHKPKQIAHWLNQLANLQVELGADINTVRETLGIIIEKFPDLPVAELTQRRLARLENEFRALHGTTVVKMGTYEQNIGLKYGRPQKKE